MPFLSKTLSYLVKIWFVYKVNYWVQFLFIALFYNKNNLPATAGKNKEIMVPAIAVE